MQLFKDEHNKNSFPNRYKYKCISPFEKFPNHAQDLWDIFLSFGVNWNVFFFSERQGEAHIGFYWRPIWSFTRLQKGDVPRKTAPQQTIPSPSSDLRLLLKRDIWIGLDILIYSKITPPIYHSIKSYIVQWPMSQVATCDTSSVTGNHMWHGSLNNIRFYTVIYWRGYFTVDI